MCPSASYHRTNRSDQAGIFIRCKSMPRRESWQLVFVARDGALAPLTQRNKSRYQHRPTTLPLVGN
jgi:hypothetical protein